MRDCSTLRLQHSTLGREDLLHPSPSPYSFTNSHSHSHLHLFSTSFVHHFSSHPIVATLHPLLLYSRTTPALTFLPHQIGYPSWSAHLLLHHPVVSSSHRKRGLVLNKATSTRATHLHFHSPSRSSFKELKNLTWSSSILDLQLTRTSISTTRRSLVTREHPSTVLTTVRRHGTVVACDRYVPYFSRPCFISFSFALHYATFGSFQSHCRTHTNLFSRAWLGHPCFKQPIPQSCLTNHYESFARSYRSCDHNKSLSRCK